MAGRPPPGGRGGIPVIGTTDTGFIISGIFLPEFIYLFIFNHRNTSKTVTQIFWANKGGWGPENQAGCMEAFYAEWHSASLGKYGWLSPWLIYVSALLVHQSTGNIRWLLAVLGTLQWASGKGANGQRSLCPGPWGIWVGHVAEWYSGLPQSYLKCPFCVEGQLQDGSWVAMGELGFLNYHCEWVGARQAWIQVSTSAFTTGVSACAAGFLLSLTFDFSQ